MFMGINLDPRALVLYIILLNYLHDNFSFRCSLLSGLMGISTRTGYSASQHAVHGFFRIQRLNLLVQ